MEHKKVDTVCQFPEITTENIESLQISNFVYEPNVQTTLKLPSKNTHRVYLVVKGEGKLKTDYKTFDLAKGSVFFCFPDKRMEFIQTQKLSLLYISFTGIEGSYLLKQLKISYVDPVRLLPEWLISVFVKEFRRIRVERGVALCAKGLLYMLFSQFSGSERHLHEDKKQSLVKAVVSMVERQYKDSTLSLKSISEELYYHFNYVSQLFQSEMGITFSAYLAEYRFRKAFVLLSETDKSIEEIAKEVGFSDGKYFSRSFKKNVGQTPTEYRNISRKNT